MTSTLSSPAPSSSTGLSSSGEPWYSSKGARFEGPEPWFFDEKDFPCLQTLEANWKEIHAELLTLLEPGQNHLKPYLHPRMSFPPGDWKTLAFYFWKLKVHENCARCPKLVKLLDSIPNLTAAALSVLEPNTKINPHYGDTNAIGRIHLGLEIPGQPPDCAFQVGEEIRAWHPGKAHIFCDAHFHMAWNYTPKRRMILILDVMRPEFTSKSDTVCARVLASITFLSLQQKLPFLNHLPAPIHAAILGLLGGVMRLFIPLQRRLPFLT